MGSLVNIDLDKLKKDYLAKRSVQEIANEYGVTVQTIYARLKLLGITRSNSESHKGLPAWNKANGYINNEGYRRITVNGEQVYEHRVIAEQILGRKLNFSEVVHHKNHDRADNRLENLGIYCCHSHHMQDHEYSEEIQCNIKKGLKSRWKNKRVQT